MIATAVLYLAKEILIPIALAVLISFLLSPLVLWMEKRGIKRSIAVVITVLVLMALVGGLGYMLAGQFVEFVNNLPKYRTNIVSKIHAVKPGKESVFKRAEAMLTDLSREMETETTATESGRTSATIDSSTTTPATKPVSAVSNEEIKDAHKNVSEEKVEAYDEMTGKELKPEEKEQALNLVSPGDAGAAVDSKNAIPVRVVEIPANTWQSFQDIVGPVFSILGTVGLVMLFVIFFLIAREDLRDRIIRLAGQSKVRVTTEALEEAANRVSRYLLMQFIVNVTYGIPVAIGLFFIGVPNALLWGAMATILRFIPYIGPWIAALMPIALSMAVFDNWTMPLLTVGLFVLLELISNNIMEPILYGHSTGVSPVAIIVSAVFWTWLWGAVGLVLATPITVVLVVLGRHIPQLAFLNVLLGDEPVLTEDARVYNRLLSGATDEAVEIAELYIDDHDLSELYDDVLLPALESAETDRSDEMLSKDRYEKFISGMNELLDAATDKFRIMENKKSLSNKGPEENEESQTATAEPSDEEPVLPIRSVLCVPVNDATDQCAAQMLKYLLMERNYEVEVLEPGLLASEITEAVRKQGSDIVVLSSVPPYMVTHTRYLAKRIHAEFSDLKLYAGLWRGDQTVEKVDERLKDAGVEQIYTSISDAGLRI